MNFQPIHFNANEAEKAGATSAFFPGNSEQHVKITRAEFIISNNTGAQGIEFDVINKDGQKGYFTLWHLKGDGSANEYSMRTLQSLMGVCGVQTLTPARLTVPKYDYTQKDTIKTPCINAQELLGKDFIGLFVETYSLYNGEEKVKTELFAAYNRERKSYREINAGTSAEDIDAALDAMLKKSAKSKADVEKSRMYRGAAQGNPYNNAPDYNYAAAKNGNAPPQNDFIEDSIPF